MFEFVDEKDKLIDSIINSKANKLNSASDIVNVLKEKEPEIYQDMEKAYANSKKNGSGVGVTTKK